MRRYELTDTQYAILEPYLPPSGTVGHPWSDHRQVLNGLFWKLRTGAPWRDIPERYGPWRRSMTGLFGGDGMAPGSTCCWRCKPNWMLRRRSTGRNGLSMGPPSARVGPPPVPAVTGFDDQEPADHALGRSVGGFGMKLHLVSDGQGVPLAATVTSGQTHESTQFEATVAPIAIARRRTGRVRGRPQRLAGDCAYHAQRIRQWLRTRGVQPVIPPRQTRALQPKRGNPITYNADAYRGRNVIERCVGWLKEWRSVARRFDKLAVNYLQTVKLAFRMRYLRLLT